MSYVRFEKLLDGFQPSFDFLPPKAIPEEELQERVNHVRREAMVNEHDVTLVNANGIMNFHTTNKYLRYLLDWNREGILIIPSDPGKGLRLFSFYTQSVILPPSWGECVGVEKLYQIGALGREYSGRPASSDEKLLENVANELIDMGYKKARIGTIGDKTSVKHWQGLQNLLPRAVFEDDTHVILDMQRQRTPNEIALIRASTQLQEIGFEAACHVCRPGVTDYELYAAFTFAQLSRGGENADGYQIGVNRWGTHCGKAYGHIVEPGDLINFYVSGISYRGYTGQIARMIAVGDITDRQEEALEVCADAIRRAEKILRPGIRYCDINHEAFTAFIERGLIEDDQTATMPYNWSANEDLSPREIPIHYVPDKGLERSGRRLMHVYPAAPGPHNPNLGHGVGMHGNPDKFNITSHNLDFCKPGHTFVMHPQWVVPQVCGANIGDCYAITENGFEKLSCHTPTDAVRIKV